MTTELTGNKEENGFRVGMTGTQCSGFSPFEADMVSRECMWICIIRLKLYQSDAACLLWDPPQQTDLKISLLQF